MAPIYYERASLADDVDYGALSIDPATIMAICQSSLAKTKLNVAFVANPAERVAIDFATEEDALKFLRRMKDAMKARTT